MDKQVKLTPRQLQRVSNFKSLYYKVVELEAFLTLGTNIEVISQDELLKLMYNLDRVSDIINDHLGELRERVYH